MNTQVLSGTDWTVEADAHGPFAATVPGSVHDALLEAGEIPSPDSVGGEEAQAFIGRTDWTWKTSFLVPQESLEEEQVVLVLESVDTVGVVYVNDVVVGSVASQFIPYRFDVRAVLRPGTNDLRVELRGTLAEAERLEREHGERPVNADGEWGPFSQLRKSACNFGWDWGPCCPTCGFAGEVRLESFSGARISGIRPQVRSLTPDVAQLRVAVDIDGEPTDARITVKGEDGTVLAKSEGKGHHDIEIMNPPIWWPRGLGAQSMISLEVELLNGARATCRTGLRHAEVDARSDDGFVVRINGEPVFCRGANWIPSRLFPHGQTIEDVEPLLQAACEANMNMIRVWGGGIYEPTWFYERCDELGLMVWQDFMFACATYPEHEDMIDLVEQEARAQVTRLARHPSIVLWCGGNEDVLAWYSWGWREKIDETTAWGLRYWTQVLPEICAELDCSRSYWVESPWSGDLDVHPNDPDRGDRHTWDLKIEGYRELVPRFVSEFGHQAPPTLRSIEEALAVPAGELTSQDLAARQRAWGGDKVQYAPYLEDWFTFVDGQAGDFKEWHWACQLLQARAISIACTWLRVNRPRCEGALIWQLNDVWTGHSWSLLDVNHRPKPVYYAVQSAFDPVLLAIEPVGDALSLVLVNDSMEECIGDVLVRRMDFEGKEIASEVFKCVTEPRRGRCEVKLPSALVASEDPSGELIVASLGERRAYWFFGKDQWLSYPKAQIGVSVQRLDPSTARVNLNARSLVRDLFLPADQFGPNARVDKGLLTLLPGETASFLVTGVDVSDELGLHELGIRTANDLITHRSDGDLEAI